MNMSAINHDFQSAMEIVTQAVSEEQNIPPEVVEQFFEVINDIEENELPPDSLEALRYAASGMLSSLGKEGIAEHGSDLKERYPRAYAMATWKPERHRRF
jgi:hypothetical protein